MFRKIKSKKSKEMITISRDDLLASFSDFEKKHDIKKARHDIPQKFIGASPSRYYHVVDMDIEQERGMVNRLFRKLYPEKS